MHIELSQQNVARIVKYTTKAENEHFHIFINNVK